MPVHSIPVPLQVRLRPGLMKAQTWVFLGLQMFLVLKGGTLTVLIPKTALVVSSIIVMWPAGCPLLLCNVVLTQWGGVPADVVQVIGESWGNCLSCNCVVPVRRGTQFLWSPGHISVCDARPKAKSSLTPQCRLGPTMFGLVASAHFPQPPFSLGFCLHTQPPPPAPQPRSPGFCRRCYLRGYCNLCFFHHRLWLHVKPLQVTVLDLTEQRPFLY